METKFYAKTFGELTTRELYEILRAIAEVFLLEQRIICQDLDRIDYKSLHCFIEDGGKIVAYMRAYRMENGEVKIGRVLSVTHGIGLGRQLMTKSIPEIKRIFNCKTIVLNAQKQAQGFYESQGFVATSEDFLEEGIPHVAMELR